MHIKNRIKNVECSALSCSTIQKYCDCDCFFSSISDLIHLIHFTPPPDMPSNPAHSLCETVWILAYHHALLRISPQLEIDLISHFPHFDKKMST